MKTTTTYLNELSITYNKKLFSNTTINNSNTTEKLIREIYEQTSSEIELKEYFFIPSFYNYSIGLFTFLFFFK